MSNYINTYIPSDDGSKQVAYTLTDEPMMLAGVCYKINNKYALIQKAKKLKCVAFPSTNNHFIITYCKESKNLNLSQSHVEVGEIVLAECTIKPNDLLFVQTHSLLRAVEIIQLLNKYLSPCITISYITYINNITFITSQEEFAELQNKDCFELFNNADVTLQWPNGLADNSISTMEQALSTHVDIEKIAIDIDQMSFESLLSRLTVRVNVAAAVAIGRLDNPDYTAADFIQEFAHRLSDGLVENQEGEKFEV